MLKWEIIVTVVAVLSGVLGYLRMIINWLRGIFVVSVRLDPELAAMVVGYLCSHARSRSSFVYYTSNTLFVRPEQKKRTVVVESIVRSPTIFMFGGALIWLGKSIKQEDDGCIAYPISYLRGTVRLDDLLKNVADWVDKPSGSMSSRHDVTRHYGSSLTEYGEPRECTSPPLSRRSWSKSGGGRLLHWDENDIGSELRTGLRGVSLDARLQSVVTLVDDWWSTREWSVNHSVPWRLSLLLTGAPGTGKSTFVRAIAEELDLPIHSMDLASMSNQDLGRAWAKAARDTPCVVLLEDIDAVFRGRENISKQTGLAGSGGLTFDVLLQCMDGVERTSGVLICLTTNHPEHLDEALTRSGRVDEIVEFANLDYTGRVRVAKMIFDDEGRARAEAMASGEVPAARFVEKCVRAARTEKLRGVVSMVPYRSKS